MASILHSEASPKSSSIGWSALVFGKGVSHWTWSSLMAKLMGQGTPGLPPHCWNYRCTPPYTPPYTAFYVGARNWTLVLRLAHQTLYQLSHRPSPSLPFNGDGSLFIAINIQNLWGEGKAHGHKSFLTTAEPVEEVTGESRRRHILLCCGKN